MVGQDGAEAAPVQGKRDHLRNLVGWLTLVPLVLLILFCSGQISVWGLRTRAAQDVHSQLTANYEQWPYEEVAPLNPAVLDIIRREDGQVEGIEPVVPGVFLPTPTPANTRPGSASTPTSLPTSTQTVKSATQTPSPTRTALPPTYTQTLAVPSATVTPTRTKTITPSATRTVTLTPTRTATYFLWIIATQTRTSTRRPADTAAPTSTSTITQLVSSTATQTLNPSPLPTVTRTPSATFIPTVTSTRTSAPTITPTSTQMGTPTFTPTVNFTPTSTPTVTDTPVVVVTHTPTVTLTPTDIFTPFETPERTQIATTTYTPEPTETSTDTPEPTETSTDTPEPTQIPLPPGINIGPGDGFYTEIGCGGGILVDLGSQTSISGLVYYEVENPSGPGTIALDWAIVSVSANSTGPWTLIFYWGDSNSGNNGYVPAIYYPPENDNQTIGFGELYNQTGIRIDVVGTYRYVLIEAPPGCDDPAQVDAIQVLP
jgi:hypothetical protein